MIHEDYKTVYLTSLIEIDSEIFFRYVWKQLDNNNSP